MWKQFMFVSGDSRRSGVEGRFRLRIGSACFRAIISVAAISTALTCGRSPADDDGQDQEREPDEAKVEKFVEELFLGEIVYPQDQGEFQFTTGYLKANKGNDFLYGSQGEDDFEIPLLFEYGLTDYVQLVAEVPIGFKRTGRADREGVGNVELMVYYNFLNDPRSGRACGYGMAVGLPTATPRIGKDAVLYEPFFVTYRQFGRSAVNLSAGIEIEDPLPGDEDVEVGGDIAAAWLRKTESFVFLTEVGVEIEPDDTLLRLAPGVYWQPREGFELGVSLPIGLTTDTPALGVFVLMTVELDREKKDDAAGIGRWAGRQGRRGTWRRR